MATASSCDLWLLDIPVCHMQAGHKPGHLLHWKDSKWVRWIKTCCKWTVCISISYLYSCLYNAIIAQTDRQTHARARARTHPLSFLWDSWQLTFSISNLYWNNLLLMSWKHLTAGWFSYSCGMFCMNAPFVFLWLSYVAWWNDPSGRLKVMYQHTY